MGSATEQTACLAFQSAALVGQAEVFQRGSNYSNEAQTRKQQHLNDGQPAHKRRFHVLGGTGDGQQSWYSHSWYSHRPLASSPPAPADSCSVAVLFAGLLGSGGVLGDGGQGRSRHAGRLHHLNVLAGETSHQLLARGAAGEEEVVGHAGQDGPGHRAEPVHLQVGGWGGQDVSVIVGGDRFGIQAVSPSGSPRNQRRWPDPENAPGSCFRRRTEPGERRSRRTFFRILNIINQVRFGSAHPQQDSSRVGKPDGQISRFRVLPPSLLLHGEDGEDHLEGAQHLNGQSLSRIQLQGDLWGRWSGGALRGWKQRPGSRVSGLRTDLVDEVFGSGLERQGQIEGPGPQAGPQALGGDVKESPEDVQPPSGQQSQREGRVHLAGSTTGPKKSVCITQEIFTEFSSAPHLSSAHFSETVSQRHDGHAHRYCRVQGPYVVLPGPGHRSAQNHAHQHQSTQQL